MPTGLRRLRLPDISSAHTTSSRLITRVLPDPQRVSGCSQQFRLRRFLSPRERVCRCRLPLQAGRRISVVRFNEGHEVWVIRIAKVWRIVVLDKYAFVLQTDDGDAVPVVICEGAESEAER